MTPTTTQMNIKTFLNLCTGNWFSQRTNYSLSGNQTESSKADLSITFVSSDDPKVSQLCQEHRLDPQQSLGGLVYSWDNSVDWGKPKKQGSSLMVFVPDAENSLTGKLLSNVTNKAGVKSSGNYVMGQDEALTLTIVTGATSVEERLWFASENLRLRSSVVTNNSKTTHTTFYSEIRKAAPKQTSQE